MRRVGPGVRAALAVLLALLGTAGCAASRSAADPAATTTTATPTYDPSVAAAQYASGTAPDAATMICSDEIRQQVAGVFGLAGPPPAPQDRWADHVYTCTYTVALGTLVLAVTVAPSVDAAGSQLQALRTQFGAVDPEQGFGREAYSAPAGALVAVKDNLVLTVDARGLPDDLGPGHQRRLDVVRLMAAAVFACWIGAS